VTRVYASAEQVPGLAMTYAPEHLRFFQARFRPLVPFPAELESAAEMPTRVLV
jgi:hypothetical protein